MKLYLHPIQMEVTTYEVQGDTLFINGEEIDMGDIPEGGLYPFESSPHENIVSDIKRVNGEIQLTILWNVNWHKPVNIPEFVIVESGVVSV